MTSRAPRDRKSTRLNSSHTEIYTLSLHDALPILPTGHAVHDVAHVVALGARLDNDAATPGTNDESRTERSEEHTSELQSHRDLHSFPTRRSSDLANRSCRSRRRPRGSARCATRQRRRYPRNE